MRHGELINYWDPACAELFGRPADHSWTSYHPWRGKLDAALGIKEYDLYQGRAFHEDKPMAEELKQLLSKLAGPHGKAILRAYRIRKGLEAGVSNEC